MEGHAKLQMTGEWLTQHYRTIIVDGHRPPSEIGEGFCSGFPDIPEDQALNLCLDLMIGNKRLEGDLSGMYPVEEDSMVRFEVQGFLWNVFEAFPEILDGKIIIDGEANNDVVEAYEKIWGASEETIDISGTFDGESFRLQVPSEPFHLWALRGQDVPKPDWLPVCPKGWKRFSYDDQNHTDFLLACGFPLDKAYDRDGLLGAMNKAFEEKASSIVSSMRETNVRIAVKGSTPLPEKIFGKAILPTCDTETTDNILVVPHLGVEYFIPVVSSALSDPNRPVFVIAEKGGETAHLANNCQEYPNIFILLFPKALELEGKTVSIDHQTLRVSMMSLKPPGRRQ